VSGTGGFASFSVPIGPDGTFRVNNLNFGSYLLTAYDGFGHVRARVTTPIVLAAPNQVASANMKFVGLGRVEGRVFNPDGSSAIGLGSWDVAQPQSGLRRLLSRRRDEQRRVLLGGQRYDRRPSR